MHSIRVKITAITMVAILISIVVLGFIAVYIVSVESDLRSTHEMNLISDDKKETLDKYLASLEQSVEMVSHIVSDQLADDDTVTRPMLLKEDRTPQEDELVDAYLKKFDNALLEAFTSVAHHTRGVVTYYYCVNPKVDKPENGFFYSKMSSEEFEEQETLDATTFDPNDMEHYTWYYTPQEESVACWLGPYKAHFLNEAWTVSYVVPMYKDGVFLGVLGMDILLDTMVEKISDIQLYKTGFICLLDGEGRLLYHPDYETGNMSEDVSQALKSDIFLQDDSDGKLIRYNAQGEERQLAFSTLANGLKIACVVPVSEITASQRHLTQIIIFAAVLLLAFFSVFTYVAMRTITGPLSRLTVASQELADGDYDVVLDYEGKDEVGVLTDSFKRMRNHLQLYIGDLSSKATKDTLTGAKNRAVLNADAKRINEAIEAAEPGSAPEFALVMLDCNRLKVVNDNYGHERGDEYLTTAFKAICKVYAHSPVYRIGGDEFAVLLENHDYEHRDELLDEFRQLAEQTNASAANLWERVDLSAGMAVYDPASDKTVEQVLHRADELMYLEKRLYKLSLE